MPDTSKVESFWFGVFLNDFNNFSMFIYWFNERNGGIRAK